MPPKLDAAIVTEIRRYFDMGDSPHSAYLRMQEDRFEVGRSSVHRLFKQFRAQQPNVDLGPFNWDTWADETRGIYSFLSTFSCCLHLYKLQLQLVLPL